MVVEIWPRPIGPIRRLSRDAERTAAKTYETALPIIMPAAASAAAKATNQPSCTASRSVTTGMLIRAGVLVSGSE